MAETIKPFMFSPCLDGIRIVAPSSGWRNAIACNGMNAFAMLRFATLPASADGELTNRLGHLDYVTKLEWQFNLLLHLAWPPPSWLDWHGTRTAIALKMKTSMAANDYALARAMVDALLGAVGRL